MITYTTTRLRLVLALAIAFACGACFAQDTPQVPSRTLSLKQALQLGLRHSPVYRGALADVAAGKADVNGANARLLPQLSANGFAAEGAYSTIFGSSPGVNPPYNVLVPSKTLLDQNAMLMIPLYTGGSLRYEAASAKSMETGDKASANEVLSQVGVSIADAYLQVLRHAEMEKALQAKVAAAQELVNTTTVQVQVGDAVPADLERVQAELAKSNRDLASELNEHEKAMVELMKVMGVDMTRSLQLTDSLQEQISVNDLNFYLGHGLSNRGAVLTAKEKASAADTDLKAAEGRYSPQLYLSGTADVSNRRGMSGGAAALTLSVPLFDGGERRAEVDKARALLEKAKADQRAAELNVEAQIREAWLDLHTALANLASAKSSVTASEDAYKVMHLRVLNGKSILIEELDAMQTLASDRADYAQALYDQEVAFVRLNQAAGLDLLEGSK